ncbi:ATP synthase subunit I [candidate division KSB1 bacterium]|nr:ATP synthase subunit I [candidate division KSB1 bacterium]
MNVHQLAFSFILGLVLGFFFFGTLWLTVRSLTHTRHPGLLVFASFLGRMGVLLWVFYLIVKDGHWQNLLACLLGFLLLRLVLVRRWRPKQLIKSANEGVME